MDLQKEMNECVLNNRFSQAFDLYQKHGVEARYHVKDRSELKSIVDRCVAQNPECNLNWLDVSAVTDMHSLFMSTQFNGDVSEWDVSNVRNMDHLFRRSAFRGDISKWKINIDDDISHIYC